MDGALTPIRRRAPRIAGRMLRGAAHGLWRLLRIAVTLAAVAAAVVLLIALWNVYEVSPWTRDGRVLVDVIDVAPEVSGTIVALPVADNQLVHKGDVLFAIDPSRFRIAVAQAQASVDAAELQLQLRQSDAKRRAGLTGIVSAEEQEQFRSNAQVASASLEAAQAALDLAKLNLERATVYAPANGYVTRLRLRAGDYASAGQPRIAIVDADSFWLEGYFEETKFSRIHVGDPARIQLMGYAPRLSGHVESFDRGISNSNDAVNALGLPVVNPVFTWVRLAQRIPVRVHIDSVPPGVALVAGMTCSIAIGGPDNDHMAPAGRLIAWLQDRL